MIDDKPLTPSSDITNHNHNLSSALEAFKAGLLRDFNVCIPACVYSYDRATREATVMPLVKVGYFIEDQKEPWQFIRRQCIKVPVRQISCGGITLDIPLYVGDTGWVISSDRDTKLLKQDGTLTKSVLANSRLTKTLETEYQQRWEVTKTHSFESGFFIPDCWGKFDLSRYKDNPNANLGTGCYIGSSFDTLDEQFNIDKTEEEDANEDDGIKTVYQSGDAYEKKTTSSIVVDPNGGVSMASSKPLAEDCSSVISTNGGQVKITAIDGKNSQDTRMEVTSSNGISISSSDKTHDIRVEINAQGVSLSMMDTQRHVVTVTMKNGSLSMQTSGDINVNSLGTMNLRAMTGINLQMDNDANIMVAGDANIHASKNVNIAAAQDVRLNSIGSVNVNTADKVNVSAADKVRVNGNDIMVAGGNSVQVNAGQLIDINTQKANINIKSEEGSVTVEAEKSNVDVHSKKVSIISEANITVDAKTNVEITGKGNVDVTAGATATVKGNNVVLSSKNLTFLGKKIVLQDSKEGKNVQYK